MSLLESVRQRPVASYSVPNMVKGGAAIFIGSAQFALAVIIAEAMYPGYNIFKNSISDLGATCSPTYVCSIFQPSSNIFTASLLILGLFLVVGAYFISKDKGWKPFVTTLVVAGISIAGVGLLPETAGSIHGVVSLMAFLSSGIAAVLSFRLSRSLFKYFSVILGVMTLVAIPLFLAQIYFGLGLGGMERMIVYPALIWYVGLGAHFMDR